MTEYEVARIFEYEDAIPLNDCVCDDDKVVFEDVEGRFLCLKSVAEANFSPSEKGVKYDHVMITKDVVNGTMPLSKRRKIPV